MQRIRVRLNVLRVATEFSSPRLVAPFSVTVVFIAELFFEPTAHITLGEVDK